MKTKKQKINIVTLGCSKNIVDSERLMRQLTANKIEVVHNDNSTNAKTVIINTCGFINDAKEESIDTILEFAKAKTEGKIDKLYVIGCLSERYKEALKKDIPEADEYFGVNDLQKIVESLNIEYKINLLGERVLTTPKHYAYLKISEGCNRTCSFCAIPVIRGRQVSKSLEELEAEAKFLISQGVKEIILIAQDLSSYGYDIYRTAMLPKLVQNLSSIEGLKWLRLHYTYPSNFPEELLDIMQKTNNICHYLDIPFQHITNNMLSAMKRGYDYNKTMQLIELFRKKVPDIALRTTLIVGHPNETEEDFEALKKFVQEVKFERLGVFTYSEEEGTFSAENYVDNIPEEEKNRRMEEIMNLQQNISYELNQQKEGKILKVLIDRLEANYFIGRTEFDSPEVDNEVLIENNMQTTQIEIGEFYNVEILRAEHFDLYGKIVELGIRSWELGVGN